MGCAYVEGINIIKRERERERERGSEFLRMGQAGQSANP